MTAFIHGPAAKALGWTLIHSLWEGAAAAVFLVVVLALTRSARVRYAAACMAMLALAAAFAITFWRMTPEQSALTAARLQILGAGVPAADPGGHASSWQFADLLPWLAPVWLIGVVLFQLRWIASWMAAAKLRRVGVCAVPGAWIERLEALHGRLQMTRAVMLLESCLTDVPVVIGYAKPVILVPLGLLAGLPVHQMEAILLHELAHIRRGDYLVNLMQTFIEGLLFYHPAAWWISRVIRAERENCCDDLVVATQGDARGYASALAALAETRIQQAALAATGGSLVKRVRRLLDRGEGPRVAPAIPAAILAVTFAVALAAWPAPQTAKPAMSPYQKWLDEEVVYIITAQEKQAFESLKTDEERQKFIEQFWDRRNPVPGSAANEFKKEHYRRLAYATDRFKTQTTPGWKTDRGRIYIQYGPPDEIESHPSGGKYTRPPSEGGGDTVTYPFEQWRYRLIEGVGKNVIIEYVDKTGTGDYRMTTDPNAKSASVGVIGGLIYSSTGPGAHATASLRSDGVMTVTVPIEFDANQYLITSKTVKADGTSIGTAQALAVSCKTMPNDTGCVGDKFETHGPNRLPPGAYTLTMAVKDAGSSTEKSYVVRFSVH